MTLHPNLLDHQQAQWWDCAINSGNGLLPILYQADTCSNTDFLPSKLLGTILNKNWFKIKILSEKCTWICDLLQVVICTHASVGLILYKHNDNNYIYQDIWCTYIWCISTILIHLPLDSHHFAEIFSDAFLWTKTHILIKISLKFVPKCPTDNNPALF